MSQTGRLTHKQYQSQWKKDHYRRKKYPFMSQVWYPLAIKDEMRNAGGFLDSPWRGVIHTTEGSSYAGARAAYISAGGTAPHFTVSFENGKFQAWQHVPLDRAARALANKRGGVETNRLRCIQIEVVARAASAHTLDREYLNGLGKLMRWIEANTQIQRTAAQFHSDKEGIILATVNSVVRFKPHEWNTFNGWCGHQHVPENHHWDPGKIDIDYLLSVDIGVRPVIDPPLDLIDVVHIRRDIYTDGLYILQQDGAVFAWEGAQYYGGSNGKPYFGDRKAARLVWPAEYEEETGRKSPYKYHILAQSGEWYGYPE